MYPEEKGPWRTLDGFDLASVPGNERQAAERVAAAVQSLNLLPSRRQELQTAVAEAVLNAMEHGNQFRPELPVSICVAVSPTALVVCVTDRGQGLPANHVLQPDLAAKLVGEQPARGWGTFLIEQMVDEVHTLCGDGRHTVQLVLCLEKDEV